MADDETTRTHESVRGEWIDAEIGSWVENPQPRHRLSDYGRALDAITIAATEYARTNEVPSEEWSPTLRLYYRDLLAAGTQVLSNVKFGLGHSYRDRTPDGLILWRHHPQPLADIRAKKTVEFTRGEIEAAAGEYLALPFRATQVDRMFVDILVAMELYAFGELMLTPASIPGFLSSSPLKRNPILEWLVSNVMTVLLGSAIWFAIWGLSKVHLFPAGWLVGAGASVAAIAVVLIACSTLMLPRAWWVVTRAKRKVSDLLDQMNGVYAELRSDGPISARHIEQRARRAADVGAVWPAPLFALLDDINARSGRF